MKFLKEDGTIEDGTPITDDQIRLRDAAVSYLHEFMCSGTYHSKYTPGKCTEQGRNLARLLDVFDYEGQNRPCAAGGSSRAGARTRTDPGSSTRRCGRSEKRRRRPRVLKETAMEWAKIEGSSQIAEMGYDAEQKVLGVRFQPTRRQAELGQPGSEYHYANVDVALATGLALAESKGKYFGENIKPFPVLYPFTKVS